MMELTEDLLKAIVEGDHYVDINPFVGDLEILGEIARMERNRAIQDEHNEEVDRRRNE